MDRVLFCIEGLCYCPGWSLVMSSSGYGVIKYTHLNMILCLIFAHEAPCYTFTLCIV